LNEVYYPSLDQACLRDAGLIVTDRENFFSEEKRHALSVPEWVEPGVPAYRLVNTCLQGRYRIKKEIVADPRRDVILQRTRFTPLLGSLSDYRVYVLLAPHLANRGWGNTAWVGDYKGVPMLFAERDGTALAVACTPAWTQGSAGFVGFSDGWQDLVRHKHLTRTYVRAEGGNVALTGEMNLAADDGTVVVAIAFGGSAMEAGHRARASLLDGFEHAQTAYIDEWRVWQRRLDRTSLPLGDCHLARTSAAVLRCHEEKRLAGGLIASLSIPWGNEKGDDDLGGYHLVWPRDMVEAAGGLLAAGAHEDSTRVLEYLRVTQEADGSWPQNMWVSGEAHWHGVQLDETALPILLVDLLRRDGCLNAEAHRGFWPMVRRAAGFIVRNGPVTQQDRWEEDPGFTPFTLAVEIAALLVAADLADGCGEALVASYLRETADTWNDCIESWIYVRGTELARQVGVDGYYVRIAPSESADAATPAAGAVPIANRPWEEAAVPASQVVSPDALALVRFGLRAPSDPRILNTLRVIDALLKVETPFGPLWRRYNGDRYGEHEDGDPFDGVGVGRPWPLLTGERAHYEIAAGHLDEARRLLRTLEACANEGGLLPEQTWDARDIPQRELCFGRPSGSAMPLAWAHAEYLKLRRSLRDGRIFDVPPQTTGRYVVDRTESPYAFWRFNHRTRSIRTGRRLRLETLVPAVVHWSTDGWRTIHDTPARATGLGEYVIDLPTETLLADVRIDFTFYWPEVDRWEREDFSVVVETARRPFTTTRAPFRDSG
jgi:glucoamylase